MNPYSPPIRGGHNKSLKLAKEIIVRAKTEERLNMGLPKKRGKGSEKIGFTTFSPSFLYVSLECTVYLQCVSAAVASTLPHLSVGTSVNLPVEFLSERSLFHTQPLVSVFLLNYKKN